MKLFISSALVALVTLVSHSAQGQQKLQSIDSSVPVSLRTFNDAAEKFFVLQQAGMIEKCQYEQAVLGMAHSLEKGTLESAVQMAEQTNDFGLVQEAVTFSNHVADAKESECNQVADKCCKKSGQADVSDECQDKTTKDCKLIGVRIKSCTEASDDC